VKYQMIDRSKAPDPLGPSTNKNMQLANELVNSLGPGKAARIELSGKETVRGAKASVTRAAKRTGKRVRLWDNNGVVYAELLDGGTASGGDTNDS